ncbi:protein ACCUMULATION AND REPLICATION OF CHLOROPLASTS 3, chloroplastic isoform X2 [Diospyros lotus]|uniref:protein ACCUMULATION AND REPLICATION OF CHLOROPLASTS 3, chloroplastic isoform X2 n=1 Tax=Diospyros lotus TaxID=55363 RepID=UPI00225225EE|nr:protein ACCUMULATION AND REPLICATION OF CHLOROPLASTS 3, chloroplastic isoform X2 [Diospyros lotus]
MELHISTAPYGVSLPSSHRAHAAKLKWFFNTHLFNGAKFRRRMRPNQRPLRIAFCCEKFWSQNGNPILYRQDECGNASQEGPNFIEVIGIGSRKDAILDFCLSSPVRPSSLRFWNFLIEDSMNVRLQQRLPGEDATPRVVEAPSVLQSSSKAVILVSYGSDYIRLVDILKKVKSTHRLIVGIVLKPFSFEGRRRQDEVINLVDKLEEYTNLFLVVDTDILLEKDLVTLDEALKTANTAISMTINAISILISDSKTKLLYSMQNTMKELKVSEVIKVLESYKEAKIGFGAGHSIKTSAMQAIYKCPFLGVGLKDFEGVLICILASSTVIDNSEVNDFLHTFHQATECTGEIIISLVHESSMEPNLIMATVITVGHTRRKASQGGSILSRLAQHFPSILNLLWRHPHESLETSGSNMPGSSSFSEVMHSSEPGEMPNMTPTDTMAEGFGNYSTELETLLSSNDKEVYCMRGDDSISEEKEIELLESTIDTSGLYGLNTEGVPPLQREPLVRLNLGQEYQISESFNEHDSGHGASPVLDNPCIYKLPVGVKASEELKNSLSILKNIRHQEKIAGDDMKRPTPRMSLNALSDATSEVVSEFYGSASSVLKGTCTDMSKKQGVLSVRAASMLEAERDSQKKWNPLVEMKYRGGIYRGRCQGGLPEGKGQLSLKDGSIYDGMWRYGKRSGLGTFYFSNGDVFQGSWRDDVMHGKGWLYFHTGDRWFVNFWKGKANGEARFYSKLGEIFFGHFRDGWRHGHFLCIDVDGARCLEIWDEGVLVSQKQLDSDAISG